MAATAREGRRIVVVMIVMVGGRVAEIKRKYSSLCCCCSSRSSVRRWPLHFYLPVSFCSDAAVLELCFEASRFAFLSVSDTATLSLVQGGLRLVCFVSGHPRFAILSFYLSRLFAVCLSVYARVLTRLNSIDGRKRLEVSERRQAATGSREGFGGQFHELTGAGSPEISISSHA
eukprot:2046829-Rhodomonas_salina.2